MKPLDSPPAEPEGDDQEARTEEDEVEIVTLVDFEDAPELDEPDYDDDEPDA